MWTIRFEILVNVLAIVDICNLNGIYFVCFSGCANVNGNQSLIKIKSQKFLKKVRILAWFHMDSVTYLSVVNCVHISLSLFVHFEGYVL